MQRNPGTHDIKQMRFTFETETEQQSAPDKGQGFGNAQFSPAGLKPFAFIVISALILSDSFPSYPVEYGYGAENEIRGHRPPAGV
ncbi:hypothetical protein [Desulfobulbus sp.]|uniref:hypothetical protein n=1 Tax=Desulfobulbus sp. TaxID=895 RepID=UPI0027BB05FD|nr:hypothetical protein [Desulfobulbus sp.]